jgi:hypothetical protein
VPKEENEVLVRLVDAGDLLFGRLERKCWVGGWLKLDVGVFLREFQGRGGGRRSHRSPGG